MQIGDRVVVPVVGAAERRHRPPAIFVEDRPEPIRDLVERLAQRDFGEPPVLQPLHRPQQPVGAVGLIGDVEALAAGEAAGNRMPAIAANLDGTAIVVNRDRHPAGTAANPANRNGLTHELVLDHRAGHLSV